MDLKKCFIISTTVAFAFVLLLFSTNISLGEDLPEQDEYEFVFANDVFFHSDQGYTSGLGILFYPALSPYTFRLGQDIYTPENKKTAIPAYGEHPYGAWLYIAADYDFEPYYYFQNTVSLDIGVVGDIALGEEVQNLVHALNDSRKGKGWGSQLNSELGMYLSFQSEFKHPWLRWDIIGGMQFTLVPYGKIRAGTIYYDYSGGASVRLSYNGKSSTALIQEVYVQASCEGRKVYGNIFLEGNDNPYFVEIEDVVSEIRAETGVQVSRYKLSFAYVEVSEEYTTQEEPSKYGILKFSTRF